MKFRLMADEPGADGAGAAPAPAPAPSAPAPSPAPVAPPAGAPAAPAPAPAADGSSALAAGQDWKPENIPEKLRVIGEDGKIDLAASLRKVDEQRSSLEKRMGSGDIRPKTPDEYKLPDSDTFKALGLDDQATAAFRKEAHEMGLSQKQYEGVMAKYAALAPDLVNAGQAETAAATTAALKEAYGADFEPKMQAAWRAGEQMAAKIGISAQELDAAIGNNPVAIRMLVALSAEMGEDKTPPIANVGMAAPGVSGFDAYMAQGDNWKAYTDSTHVRHQIVSAEAAKITAAAAKS